jgi:hypothetical protein
MEMAAAGELPATTRPLLLFPEVSVLNSSSNSQTEIAGLTALKNNMQSCVSVLATCSAHVWCVMAQGTTTNGKCLLPFKSGAFLAGAPVQPVILRYGEDRISPAWESIGALWHSILMLANPFHSVTARQVCYPSNDTPDPIMNLCIKDLQTGSIRLDICVQQHSNLVD